MLKEQTHPFPDGNTHTDVQTVLKLDSVRILMIDIDTFWGKVRHIEDKVRHVFRKGNKVLLAYLKPSQTERISSTGWRSGV